MDYDRDNNELVFYFRSSVRPMKSESLRDKAHLNQARNILDLTLTDYMASIGHVLAEHLGRPVYEPACDTGSAHISCQEPTPRLYLPVPGKTFFLLAQTGPQGNERYYYSRLEPALDSGFLGQATDRRWKLADGRGLERTLRSDIVARLLENPRFRQCLGKKGG